MKWSALISASAVFAAAVATGALADAGGDDRASSTQATRALRAEGAGPELDDPYRIQFTALIPDDHFCHAGVDKIPMCVSRNFACRMESNQMFAAKPPSCQPVDDDITDLNEKDLESIEPWEPCDASEDDIKMTQCQLLFQCRCARGDKSQCYCVPPDVVSKSIGSETCGVSEDQVCETSEYCQWQEDGTQACAPKPYAGISAEILTP
ncbi:hypothetical protein Poli38472_008210 [Pythium oligandrum]|uniref:Uncharacterized protein n=1 Tax=Pythium oligandrum TaxID=41045 RepID=A0A8K1CMD6_PYTOL|nr:hypothetical protein Poli38472_008210 [Pythium oligandrum]|eukprot:TMW65568.1 hypothetical protein Poli38472_008210 [Pythium oligandrum]